MRQFTILISLTLLCLSMRTVAAAQNLTQTPPLGPEAQKCAALMEFKLEDARGGPALITSARLIEVPPSGLEHWILTPSGFASGTVGMPRLQEMAGMTALGDLTAFGQRTRLNYRRILDGAAITWSRSLLRPSPHTSTVSPSNIRTWEVAPKAAKPFS